jgi:GTP1/Obg family GTP-binding protein
MDKPEKLTTLGTQDTRQRQTNKKHKQNNTAHYVLDTTIHKQLEVKMNWTSFYAEIVNGHHDHDYTSPCMSNRQNLRCEIRKLMRKYIHIIGFCYSAPLRITVLFKFINVFHILKQGICFMCCFQFE